MRIEIKPCPFCGGEAKVFKHKKAMASFGTLFSYEVECTYCFCRTGRYPSEEKAVSAWNRRKADSCEGCMHRYGEKLTCQLCARYYRDKYVAERRTDDSQHKTE